MARKNIGRLFESRSGNLDQRVKQDYVRNGVATIPCKVTDVSDVISKYSLKGFEIPDPEFVEYVRTSAEVTPSEYPIVLDIVSDSLSAEEKNAISEALPDHFAYLLGMVEKDEKRHKRTFLLMMLGLIVSGILLFLSREILEEVRELFFILFWFMGDTLCDYIFLTGYDIRRERRLAGRLASIRIVFSDTFKSAEYTENEVDRIYSEIEKDVNQTL